MNGCSLTAPDGKQKLLRFDAEQIVHYREYRMLCRRATPIHKASVSFAAGVSRRKIRLIRERWTDCFRFRMAGGVFEASRRSCLACFSVERERKQTRLGCDWASLMIGQKAGVYTCKRGVCRRGV